MAKSSEKRFAVGVDYGTNSVRALVVDVGDGSEVATQVFDLSQRRGGHPARLPAIRTWRGRTRPTTSRVSTNRWAERSEPPASSVAFRPRRSSASASTRPARRRSRSTARACRWRCSRAFRKNLAAHAWLWKDHTGHAEAAEITERAARDKDGYLTKCGGTYSSEWYWSKILHCQRTAPKVFAAAYSWVELADFVPGFITGNLNPDTMPRGICAAGHKAMYHEQWGGLPSRAFLKSLDPGLACRARPLRGPGRVPPIRRRAS